jgi:hypothetical protein
MGSSPNTEHRYQSECAAKFTLDKGVLLGGRDAAGSTSQQGAQRVYRGTGPGER